jgi:hypothetical protein
MTKFSLCLIQHVINFSLDEVNPQFNNLTIFSLSRFTGYLCILACTFYSAYEPGFLSLDGTENKMPTNH